MDTLSLARAALLEDRFSEDATTDLVSAALREADAPGIGQLEFRLVAKSRGVFSGGPWVRAVAEAAGLRIIDTIIEGSVYGVGESLVVGSGPGAPALAAERTLLNGLQHMCGIASLTRRYVDLATEVASAHRMREAPGIYHTRKTLPLLRDLELAAVKAGGGRAHRRDLAGAVLLKENHKQRLGAASLSLGAFVRWAIEKKRRDPATLQIEVETMDEAIEVVRAGGRFLLLDNFHPTTLKETLHLLPPDCLVEVSGGVNLDSLPQFVMPGVHRISVGALTHSAAAADISFDWREPS